MPLLARQGIVEAIATFMLIFVGAGAIIGNGVVGGAPGLTGIALVHGLVIFAGVAATGHISGGHLNPAVTVGFLLTRRIGVTTAGVYIVAQLIGATVAAFALRATYSEAAVAAVDLGTPALNAGVSVATGIVVEIILTFILVFVIFQTAGHPRGPAAIAPLAIGMTVTLDIFVGGPLTGAAMNPARAFGPALAGGYWADWYVYWIGPLLGSAAAALFAHHVIQREERA